MAVAANTHENARLEFARREWLALWLSAVPCCASLLHAAVHLYMRWTGDLELIRRWDKAYPNTLLLLPVLFVVWVIALHRVLAAIRTTSRLSLRTFSALIMLLIPTLPAWRAWYSFLASP